MAQVTAFLVLQLVSVGFAAVVSPELWTRRVPSQIRRSKSVSMLHLNSAIDPVVKDRMAYWKTDGAPPHEFTTNERYLLFDYDHGGLNNIRMGWEMAALAAVESNRTLVYPPRQALYLKKGEPSGLDYYVNMEQLRKGLNVISMAEFLQRELPGVEHEHSVVLLEWAKRTDGVDTKDPDFPGLRMRRLRSDLFTDVAPGGEAKGDVEVCDMERYRGKQRVVYTAQPGARIFSCGNWPNVGEPRFSDKNQKSWSTPDWAMLLLRNNFVWHPDAFEIAGHVVEHLGLWNYVAVHARYGDFQFQDGQNPSQTLLKTGWLAVAGTLTNSFLQTYQKVKHAFRHSGQPPAASFLEVGARAKHRATKALGLVRRWLGEGGNRTVYISTDEDSPEYLKPFREAGLNVVRWRELMEQAQAGKGPLAGVMKKYSPRRWENLVGLAEQIICTYGRVFIGSEKSTFTGFIERMRLYAEAPTAHTFIQYNGLKASNKGLRLFHTDAVDPTVEAGVQKELDAFDQRNGTLSRDDLGKLPA